MPDGFHQIARHACKFQQVLHIHLRQRADDLVHIAARTEIFAGACYHDCIDILVVDE